MDKPHFGDQHSDVSTDIVTGFDPEWCRKETEKLDTQLDRADTCAELRALAQQIQRARMRCPQEMQNLAKGLAEKLLVFFRDEKCIDTCVSCEKEELFAEKFGQLCICPSLFPVSEDAPRGDESPEYGQYREYGGYERYSQRNQ